MSAYFVMGRNGVGYFVLLKHKISAALEVQPKAPLTALLSDSWHTARITNLFI